MTKIMLVVYNQNSFDFQNYLIHIAQSLIPHNFTHKTKTNPKYCINITFLRFV